MKLNWRHLTATKYFERLNVESDFWLCILLIPLRRPKGDKTNAPNTVLFVHVSFSIQKTLAVRITFCCYWNEANVKMWCAWNICRMTHFRLFGSMSWPEIFYHGYISLYTGRKQITTNELTLKLICKLAHLKMPP